MLSFAPVKFDERSLSLYRDLFFTCFSKSSKFELPGLGWLYKENPDGYAIGFDAFDGENLAAHYVCIPAKTRVNGVMEKGLLSLNTATHPRYQGKGLFTKLAEMTYAAAAEQGFTSVYGVANANSTPGFVRKLGFQLVQPLDAMIGVGALNIDFLKSSEKTQFERVWTRESLNWRRSNPNNRIVGFPILNGIGFQARAFGRLLPAYAELKKGEFYDSGDDERQITPFRLFLGLVPNQACKYKGYASIPHRLRPSPLNMIFRPLKHAIAPLEAGYVSLSFLDFDAY